MTGVSLSLMGQFAILVDDRPQKMSSLRGQALLIYLHTEQILGARLHTREALMTLLWPGMPLSSAQVSLRQTLYQIRRALPAVQLDEQDEPVPLLITGRRTVQIDPRYPLTSDLAELLVALKGPQKEWVDLLEHAQTDFLSNFFLPDANEFENWVMARRAAFRRQIVDALDQLTDAALVVKDYQRAIRLSRRQIGLDSLRESAHRQLMTALALDGHRSQALVHFAELESLLNRELATAPSAATLALGEQLRSDEPIDWSPLSDDPAARRARQVGHTPFRGLAAFREQDAPFFFGREPVVADLLAAVRQQPGVQIVVGASGAGKSSLVMAGLVPVLREDGWLIITGRPGEQPFHALAASLLTALEPDQRETDRLIEIQKLGQALAESQLTLIDVTRRLGEKHGQREKLLLIIDQFEELFTLCPDETLRGRLIEGLFAAAADGTFPAAVILTLRADFIGEALGYPPLDQALQDNSFMLGPMSEQGLLNAVVKPAEMQGAAFEEGLAERIVKDVGREPGRLPLLEFALTQLWDRQEDGWLTHAQYDNIGQVDGALARYADQVVAELNEEEKTVAKKIFVQLVRPGQGALASRRIASRSDFNEEQWTLANSLAGRRLIVIGRSESRAEMTIELIHEALIHEWAQLRSWITADQSFRSWQEKLRVRMRGWLESDRDDGALLHGAALAEGQEWLNLRADQMSYDESYYIETSLFHKEQAEQAREQQRQAELAAAQQLADAETKRATAEAQRAETQSRVARQLRRLTAGLTILLLVAIGSTFWAWQQNRRAAELSRVSTARELAAAALNHLAIDPERSILLALEAVKLTYEENGTVLPEAETVLHQAVAASHVVHRLEGHRAGAGTSAWVTDVAFSPDGSTLVTASGDNTVKIWDVATGEEKLSIVGEESPFGFWGVAFSPDGRLVAAGSSNESIYIWDARSGEQVAVLGALTGHTELVNRIAFSPNGRELASTSVDGSVRLWNLATGRMEAAFSTLDSKPIYDVAYSPDGNKLAAGGENNEVTIWGGIGEQIVFLTGHLGAVQGVAFSPDGEFVASGSSDGTARIWDVNAQAERLVLAGHTGPVWNVEFSSDGRRLATVGEDGTARIWDLTSGKQLLLLAGHTDVVLSLAIDSESNRLATASKDQTARIWDLTPDHELLAFDSGVVYEMALSEDGRRLVTTSGRGTATLWDMETGEPLLHVSLVGEDAPLDQVALHLEGSRMPAGVAYDDHLSLLAVGDELGRVGVWDTSTGERVAQWKAHREAINGLAFSPDGGRLATTSEDETAILWDVTTQEEIFTLEGHIEWVWRVFFSPSGDQLLTTSPDDTAILWDSHTGERLHTFVGHSDKVSYAAFGPDGQRLATASGDGTVIVWELGTEKSMVLAGHTSAINGVTFSGDGRLIATAGTDGTMRVWDAQSGEEIKRLSTAPVGVGSVIFNVDGTQLISSHWDNTVRRSTLSIDELMALAQARLTRTLIEEECRRFLHKESCS